MNRRDFSKILGAAAVTPAALSAAQNARAAPSWSFSADIAECCSCEIPCPCNFGRPTTSRCDGNRLIEIREGMLDDDELRGLRFLVTFEMGKWTRIYIDESLDDRQSRTLDTLLPLAFGGFLRLSRSVERVPLRVSRRDDLISFSTPASRVEMKPLAGLDGAAITISGLPSNVFHEYRQYESVTHVHEGRDRSWSHAGTNGFTSRMLAGSEA